MKYLKLVFILILFTFKSFSQSVDEKSMIDEINLVRTNPKLYKTYVEDYYKKNRILLKFNGMDKCLSELLDVLDTIKPMKPILFSTSLYKSLAFHGGIDSINSIINHDNISNRIVKYSKDFRFFGENIILFSGVGKEKSARDCVIELITDWKVDNRGHRKNILSNKFSHIATKKIVFKTKKYFIVDFAG